MDYNVVSKGAKEVVSNYLKNPEQYEQGLKTFYKEGVKNPSVARILFQDEAAKNSRECVKTQKKLLKEYDEFTPTIPKTQTSDFHPKNALQEMFAESAAEFVNTITESMEELTYKHRKLVDIIINHDKMISTLNTLDRVKMPENIKQEKEVFDKAFDTMYPRTGEIRKNLIKYNIRKDKVTPRMPENKRHYITEPKEGWFEKYPKTAGVRLDILEGKQPKKPTFWTKVKDFFKSDEKLAKENEAKLEQRKKDYEQEKLVREISIL